MGELSFADGADFAMVQYRLGHLASWWGLQECDCEDCTQEALLALLSQHPDWRTDNLRTWLWLRRVLRHKATDAYRRAFRHGDVHFDEQVQTSGTGAPTSDRHVADLNPAALRKLAVIDGALSELTEENRNILVMHAGRGMTFAEIGEMLGLTAGRAEWRYRRALRQVRCLLAAMQPHPPMDDIGGRVTIQEGSGGDQGGKRHDVKNQRKFVSPIFLKDF